ncbi:hypothetical protein HID58_019476 [Brassica napus]|uniref:G-patch domain-containing protein n=1 Tax=Brassica napus TaxID=3708 RepID=A0ABQ8DFH9_BRANA|nr:hypothetical protein HID58_019476 [Brassica napus]
MDNLNRRSRPSRCITISQRIIHHHQLRINVNHHQPILELLKKMGFKDGKGLGKYEDGILEPIMATKLPKYMGLDHAVQFIEDHPPSKKATDHNFRSCMERPKVFTPFKEVKPMTLAASPFKKVKPMTPTEAVKDKKIVQKQHRKRWKFDPLASPNENFTQNQVTSWGHESQNKLVLQEQEKSSLVVYLLEEEEKKTFDEFIDNLQNENALENEQDKPKKDTAGIEKKDDIVEHLLVTQLPKHIWLDGAILFIKDNPQSKLKDFALVERNINENL